MCVCARARLNYEIFMECLSLLGFDGKWMVSGGWVGVNGVFLVLLKFVIWCLIPTLESDLSRSRRVGHHEVCKF